jgi:hypothetical protein
LPPGPSGALRLAAPASADQLTIWPLVLFTDTIHVGSVTALLPFTTTYTVNAWSQLCYGSAFGSNINCSGIDIESWFAYGLDPSQGVALWLENMNDPLRGQGQVATYTSLPAGWDGTNADSTGVWMASPTGIVSQQSCLAMQRAGDQHQRVLLPIADRSNDRVGNNTAYHIRNFAAFEVLHPTSGESCSPNNIRLQGRFLGYTWRNTEATATGDLGASYTNGQIVLPFAPPDPPAPPTVTATATDTPTAASATDTPTATDTPPVTNTAIPTETPAATATETATNTATAAPPTGTPTSTPSLTALPPTVTPTPPSATPVPPTGTPLPPTSTPPAPPSHTPAPPPATATVTTAPPAATVTASATPCAAQFSDVWPDDYFATPVAYLACHRVISGYSDGTFRPGNPTTRGQMVKIVVGGFGRVAPPASPPGGYSFADVPPAHPFYRYIETAAALGIVSGYTCGGPGEDCDSYNRPYFRPGADVTRGQLSKIVVNAAGWPVVTPAVPTFSDVPVGSPFYGYIETAACRGVVSGYAGGTFRPAAGATRGQIAKIVYGALTLPPACAAAR